MAEIRYKEKRGLFPLKGNVSVIIRLIIGAIVGGLLGYGVYRVIGCSSGACPITSNPWITTIFGIIFGALLAKPN